MVEWATLPCTHGFHLDCLSDWINQEKCVVCKMPLAVGPKISHVDQNVMSLRIK
jgi:hypothetical protein